MKGGLPTISFRDLTIQRREDDLVCASFGRGFWILDDISPLRNLSREQMKAEAILFDSKAAHWYTQKDEIYGQGNSEYAAKNPPYGANFTYYLKEGLSTKGSTRKKDEKKAVKAKRVVQFPGWDALDEEILQEKPGIYLTIRDNSGKVIRTIKGANKKGINRSSWDLSVNSKDVVKLDGPRGSGGWLQAAMRAVPGEYSVTLSKVLDGVWTDLAGPKKFQVVPLMEGHLPGKSHAEIASFRTEYQTFQQDLSKTNILLSRCKKTVKAMNRSLTNAENPSSELIRSIHALSTDINAVDLEMNGSKAKAQVGEKNPPKPGDGNFVGIMALRTTYGPTGNQINAFNRAKEQLMGISKRLNKLSQEDIPQLIGTLKAAGAPPIEGW